MVVATLTGKTNNYCPKWKVGNITKRQSRGNFMEEAIFEPGLKSCGSYMETRGHFKQKEQCVQRLDQFCIGFYSISLLSLRHMPNNFEEAPRNMLRKGREIILKLQINTEKPLEKVLLFIWQVNSAQSTH